MGFTWQGVVGGWMAEVYREAVERGVSDMEIAAAFTRDAARLIASIAADIPPSAPVLARLDDIGRLEVAIEVIAGTERHGISLGDNLTFVRKELWPGAILQTYDKAVEETRRQLVNALGTQEVPSGKTNPTTH